MGKGQALVREPRATGLGCVNPHSCPGSAPRRPQCKHSDKARNPEEGSTTSCPSMSPCCPAQQLWGIFAVGREPCRAEAS